jgi:hypothetical protein
MNPTDSLHDSITVTNPDTDPFEIVYNSQSYGEIMPGETRSYPRFLVEHFLKHLIDQTLNHRNISTGNVIERQKLREVIVLDEKKLMPTRKISEAERIQKEIEELNSDSDLSAILNKRSAEEQNAAPSKFGPSVDLPELDLTDVPETAGQILNSLPQTNQEAFAQTPSETPQEEVVEQDNVVTPTPTEEIAPTESNETGLPSRESLYTFAQNVLMMNVNDKKTKEAFDAMTVPQLMQELNYER